MLRYLDHPVLEAPTEEEFLEMDPEMLLEHHRVYHQAIIDSERDPYRFGFVLDNWERAKRMLDGGPLELRNGQVIDWVERTWSWIFGGNRCLAPEQEIYDPVAGVSRPVSQIDRSFHVYAWDEAAGQVVKAVAHRPFRKRPQGLFRISLDDGSTYRASAEHLILTHSGWKRVGDLTVGDEHYSPCAMIRNQKGSILAFAPPASRPNVPGLTRKPLGSRVGYLACLRSCGARLLSWTGSAPIPSPLPVGVPEYREYASAHWGGRDNRSPHIRFRLLSDRPATLDAEAPTSGRSSGTLCHAFCRPCKSAWRLFSRQARRAISRQSWLGSTLGRLGRGLWLWGMGSRHVSAWGKDNHSAKVVKIDYLRVDNVWDFEVPKYHNYIIGNTVHHNSSKSRFASWMVMNALVKNPGSLITCWSQNQEASNLNQQPYLWEFMPVEMRRKQRDVISKINYSKAGGFTENQFILPNGSQCLFKFYTQYEQDNSIVEGMELGALSPRDGSGLGWTNIGAWFDEYLGGPELFETMKYRLATRNAKGLMTFTPIDGYTETVRQVRDGARVIERRPAELLGGEMVEYILDPDPPENPHRFIMHFFSEDNPFGRYERIKQELHGAPREKILTRAYGVAVKSATSKFPLFSRDVNVVKAAAVPKKDVTRYLVIDPAGRKNWFMLWIGVDVSDSWYVYREWPGVEIGEWAEWKSGKWRPGLGAKGLGYGISQYKEEILTLEGWEKREGTGELYEPANGDFEKIEERLIDPRLGANTYQGPDGETSIIQQLDEQDLVCIAAPGLHEEDGIQAIVDKMYYDIRRPMDATNRPHFYISEECENTILALSEYTGEGGKDEPWKDPIDCLRYAGTGGIEYVSERNEEPFTKSGGY